MGFVDDVAGDARLAAARTGVPVSVILAQWIDETGNGTSAAWRVGHNYAGVSPGGHVAAYPDRTVGLAAYVRTLSSKAYDSVRAAAASGPDAAAQALGRSPWAASHYGGQGQDLLRIIQANDLTRFDDPSAPAGSKVSLPDPGGIVSGALGAVGGVAGGAAGAVAGAAVDKVAAAVQPYVVFTGALLVAGGLVLAGAWQLVKAPAERLEAKGRQAATVAAAVA